MSNPPSPLRPAPLSFGRSDSGRMSPFRRPESPLGRSPSTVRAATPSGSPLKQSTQSTLNHEAAASPKKTYTPAAAAAADDRSWINSRNTLKSPTIDEPSSPTKSSPALASSTNSLNAAAISRFDSPSISSTSRPSNPRANTSTTVRPSLPRSKTGGDPLSSIPPQHLHSMRESFSVLDHKNTGSVTQADLVRQLNELGLDSSPAALSSYFPPGTTSINLATYLNLLSADLARLTSSAELMDALSTFDADDSGQIDVQELKDALLSTMPEPGEDGRRLSEREVDMVMDGYVGRRAFRRGAAGNTAGLGTGDRRPVFRYGDFVKGIWGVGPESEKIEVA